MTEHLQQGPPPSEVPAPHGTGTHHDRHADNVNDTPTGRHSECSAPLVGRGRDLAHRGRTAATAPIPAVGPVPDVATVFVGTLLWSSPADSTGVLKLVADDDLESVALSVVLSTIRRLTKSASPCDAQSVMDELQREGAVNRDVAVELMHATTSGGAPSAARYYAAAVVSQSLRRRVESAGHALVSAASAAPEVDLAPLASRAVASIADCAARLATLRKEAI